MHEPDSALISPAAGRDRPTHVRRVVVLVLVAMAVVLYLDRFCVSFAERYIMQDLALGGWQMSAFLSAFFWAYAIAQVPAGWLGDRRGGRAMLAIYIIAWSLCTALIGAATGAIVLIAMRLGCGLAQAGAYPISGSLLSRWVPFSRRALASGLVALGGRGGAVLAPILTAYLMVLFVPASTPSELGPHSILDLQALDDELAPAESKGAESPQVSAAQRLFDRLPDDVQNRVRAIAGRKADATAEDARSLAQAFNALLPERELFEVSEIDRLPLEREAVGLLRRRERGQSLSPDEVVRFNRLVLEAVFPRQISKLYVKGWRPVLFVYGIGGLAVALLHWICVRNSPAAHPRCNAAERALIAGDSPTKAAGASTAGRDELRSVQPARTARATEPDADAGVRSGRRLIDDLLASRSLWLSSISQFGTNVAWLFFVTYLPRYLMEVHQVPILERSWMVAIPPLAGIAGLFLGGHLTDLLTQRFGLRWGRALPMGLTKFVAAAAYLACVGIASPWLATVAFALCFFFVDLGVSPVWAYMQDVGGRNVAAVLGWGNMWGNFGAAIAPFLYELVLGSSPGNGDWNVLFGACAGTFIVSGLAGLFIDATVPVSRD